MDSEKISGLIESMAADFLCLSGGGIDIPMAGVFLRTLEKIVVTAQEHNIIDASRVAQAMSSLVEYTIMNEVPDRAGINSLLEEGITLLQGIVMAFLNGAEFHQGRKIHEYEISVGRVTGYHGELPESAHKTQGEVFESPKGCSVGVEMISLIDQDESLLKDFIAESLEYIEQIEINILNLEQDPEDRECINAIFRPFHSIKGVAGFLNLETIRDLAHSLENLLDKARKGEIKVSPPIIDVILDGADTLKTMIGRLRQGLTEGAATVESLDTGELMKRIHLIEEGISNSSHGKRLGDILVQEGIIGKEVLEAALEEGANQEEGKRKVGEVLIARKLVTPKQVSQALRKQAEMVTDTGTIRVETRKLDDVIDMVGELVITQAMIQQDIRNLLTTDRNLMRDISQLFRITSSLQRVSTGLRMVPIKQSFQRMARLIRDLAKSGGKLVSVELVGEETEIDRNMVDEIYTPLVHLVRNAVDHGIETPNERVRAGKPEKGSVRLKAYHRGGNIVIEIADDGRGLDREKILRKATAIGLVGEGEHLSDQEIFRLIFHPGLSTAEKITDVSGRGVGMDVVKQAVDRLRGKIEIESSAGRGSTFITSFPLTMAIIDGLIVRVGTQRYILPSVAVRQALCPTRDSYSNVIGRGEQINVRGKLLPIVRLNELFALDDEKRDPWNSIVVVMEGNGRSKAIMVDEILGKAEVVIKSLGERLKNVQGIAGGAIMGDGQIGLIIDAESLFNLSESVH